MHRNTITYTYMDIGRSYVSYIFTFCNNGYFTLLVIVVITLDHNEEITLYLLGFQPTTCISGSILLVFVKEKNWSQNPIFHLQFRRISTSCANLK